MLNHTVRRLATETFEYDQFVTPGMPRGPVVQRLMIGEVLLTTVSCPVEHLTYYDLPNLMDFKGI